MAVMKRPPRRKVMKVYDLKGKEHVMSVLNARDMVQHNRWTTTPPVVRTVYVDQKGNPVNVTPVQEEVAPEADEEAEDEPLPPVGFHDTDGEEDDGEEVELLNDPEDGSADQVDNGDEEIVVLDLTGKNREPSKLDPSGWTKDEIVKYAQDKYATKLDGRHSQMALVEELMALVNALGG